MTLPDITPAYSVTHSPPPHLTGWQLPPDWRWGPEGVSADYRHYQEVIDALGRSLSLVTAPDPAHMDWLFEEARHLAGLSHPAVPTTYHWWTWQREARRGPGYLRRWITGETIGSRLRRLGPADIPFTLQLLRSAGAALVYLHDAGTIHGAVGADTVYTIPAGRLWFLGWQWALPKAKIPPRFTPDQRWMPQPPEWASAGWRPDAATDQWQLAALCYATLTGEIPPPREVPPVRWARPDCPQAVAAILDRALHADPRERFYTVGDLLRNLDRVASPRTLIYAGTSDREHTAEETEEARLRWALGDEYEVVGTIGSGTFGSVWRVRDFALERVVALKMLHPHIARDETAVARFQREARLAAQLAHPAIVPIYDWDARGEVSWYTMELAEVGSLADLVARSGGRPLEEIAPQIEHVLDGLAAAHANGIIHRDLKPENILIDRYRRWRIADFGIANVTGEELAGATGTPAFAAPEQLLGESQGPQVDYFAIAGIVAFALSGHPPFAGGDGPAVLAQQLSGRIDLDFAPPPIAEWLRRGLAADPAERFGDAETMLHAWRAAVASTTRQNVGWQWVRRLVRR